MDTFKKIYIALIGITVISLIVLCAESIGIFTVSGESSANLYYLAGEILLYSILFALTANVIANKNNRLFGYVSLFFELFCILFVVIVLIANIGYSEAYYNFNKIISYISAVNILLLLIYCVPSANSSHNKFQHLAAVLTIVTYAIYAFTSSSSSLTSSLLSSITDYDTSSYYSSEEDESSDFVETIGTVLTYGVIGMMIVNPMLRVYYIDKDYSNADEINEILNPDNKYEIDTKSSIKQTENQQPTAVIQQAPVVPPKPEIVPASTQQVQNPQFIQPVEEIHEKVVNPNFKQEDLPEAVIPTISVDAEEPITPTEPSKTEAPVAPTEPAKAEEPVKKEEPTTPDKQ